VHKVTETKIFEIIIFLLVRLYVLDHLQWFPRF